MEDVGGMDDQESNISVTITSRLTPSINTTFSLFTAPALTSVPSLDGIIAASLATKNTSPEPSQTGTVPSKYNTLSEHWYLDHKISEKVTNLMMIESLIYQKKANEPITRDDTSNRKTMKVEKTSCHHAK